jgi:hypothetical protein
MIVPRVLNVRVLYPKHLWVRQNTYFEFVIAYVTTRIFQKRVGENFRFLHMPLLHHQSYKMAGEYICNYLIGLT